MNAEDQDRWDRAVCALEGLSVGDAFGEHFFYLDDSHIQRRTIPPPPWCYTDDTNMALSIMDVLGAHGSVDQDHLARSFAARYDDDRGYGMGMHWLLRDIRAGKPWREVAARLFDGQGSYGNGAAMRVAPIGAFFADDLDAVVTHARHSAEVTHTHPEGIAGAIAVAAAAAWAWRLRTEDEWPGPHTLLYRVLPLVPKSIVQDTIRRAIALPSGTTAQQAGATLGNGRRISAQDTVAFALWCSARYLADYEEALWQTVSALGDMDTTCAIVGGIVVMYTGVGGIPSGWREAREPLPDLPAQ